MKLKFLLSQIILLTGLFAFSQSTTVYTCKGGSVAANIYPEFSQAQITSANNQTMSQYGYLGITFLGNSSAQYNCHSYAWHLREGNSNKVWINNASQQTGNCFDQTHNIDKYWTDGCFIQVCNEADADKLHYYCGDHSAVKSTTNPGYYESKWGQLAVVRHTKTGVPYADPTNSVNFYASTKITGDVSNLCTGTRTFSVKNISGGTYIWTYSSTLSVVGATNTNQLTIQRNGSANGAAWVQVQISTSCSSTSATSRMDFTVGVPDAYLITAGSAQGSGSMQGIDFYYNGQYPYWDHGEPTKYFEFESLHGHFIYGQPPTELSQNPPLNAKGATVIVNANSGSGTVYLRVRAHNSCGDSEWRYFEISLNGQYYFMVSPNPATDLINITKKKENTSANTNKTLKSGITEIKIFDRMGTLKKQTKYGNGTKQTQLNTSGLTTGVYFLEISSGQYKERQQVIIQK